MSRSIKKGPFVAASLVKKIDALNETNDKKVTFESDSALDNGYELQITEVTKEEKAKRPGKKLTKKEKENLLKTLMKEMQAASRNLEFERAAELRDMIFELQESMGTKNGKIHKN